MTNMSVI